MTDERLVRHRRSIRLRGYDYAAAGAYFVTIAAQGHECLFGQVVDGEVCLNEAGRMVESQWLALAGRFSTIDLDEFVVMPNHFHGIILLEPPAYAADGSDGGRAAMNPAPTERPAMDRATACDVAPAVGATLVVAQNAITTDMVARNCVAPDGMARPNGGRAGMNPAPTAHLAMDRANACDAAPSVGANLVVARCGFVEPGNRAGTSPAPTANATDSAPTLGTVVGAFKSITTQAYVDGVRKSGWPPFVGRLWQRNYYEHIIRTEKSLDRIRVYVVSNPQRWDEDRENQAGMDKPSRPGRLPQPWET